MFPLVGSLLASLTPEILAGLGIAATAGIYALSQIFKPVQPKLPNIAPEIPGQKIEDLGKATAASLPAGFQLKDFANYGITAMGFVAFMEFILEEAIQTVNMGLWIAIQNKQLDVAERLTKKSKELIAKLRTWAEMTKYINPFSYDAFVAFADAAEEQINAYKKIIEAGGTISRYKPKTGGIYDMR